MAPLSSYDIEAVIDFYNRFARDRVTNLLSGIDKKKLLIGSAIAATSIGGMALGLSALSGAIRKGSEKKREQKIRGQAEGFIMGKTSAEAKEHQKRILEKLKNNDNLLIYHGMGSGKTLSSILAGKQEGLPMTVIGPASLRHNYPKEMGKHKVNVDLDYYSYHKPPENPETLLDRLLVFDEAHQMGRMQSERSKYPDIYSGKKTILMTGTPIRNYPSELIPILRGLGIPIPRDEASFKKYFIKEVKKYPSLVARLKGVEPGVERHGKNLDLILNAVKGKVDYHEERSDEYPDVNEEDINVEMSKRQYKTYSEMAKGYPSLAYKIKHGLPPSKSESRRLNAFMSSSRQISNTPVAFNLSASEEDEPKINRAVEEILRRIDEDKNYRGITYSNYLSSGLNPISRRLTVANIPHARFTGELSNKEKDKIINDYNTGKILHLLVSSAGSEGLDLKGTKLMQILEPHWHKPKLDQVKARAIRIGSHSHLPEGERVVNIQNFLAVPPKKILGKRPGGADEYLSMLSESKDKLNQEFLDILRKASNGGYNEAK